MPLARYTLFNPRYLLEPDGPFQLAGEDYRPAQET